MVHKLTAQTEAHLKTIAAQAKTITNLESSLHAAAIARGESGGGRLLLSRALEGLEVVVEVYKIYVYVYIYTYIHTYIHTHTRTHTEVYTHMQARAHTHTQGLEMVLDWRLGPVVLRVERERARAAKVNRDAARLQLQVHKHREDAGQTDEVLEVRGELAHIYA
jgi:hypothetical protein